MKLAERLVSQGAIAEADLPRVAKAQSAAPSRPLHEILIEHKFAPEEVVLAALGEELGMEVVDLTQVTAEPETLKAMPAKLVHRRTLFPLARRNGSLVVATANPFDLYALDELQTLTGLHVE